MGAPFAVQVVADAYAQRVELDADGLALAVDGLDDGGVEVGCGGGSGGGIYGFGLSHSRVLCCRIGDNDVVNVIENGLCAFSVYCYCQQFLICPDGPVAGLVVAAYVELSLHCLIYSALRLYLVVKYSKLGIKVQHFFLLFLHSFSTGCIYTNGDTTPLISRTKLGNFRRFYISIVYTLCRFLK